MQSSPTNLDRSIRLQKEIKLESKQGLKTVGELVKAGQLRVNGGVLVSSSELQKNDFSRVSLGFLTRERVAASKFLIKSGVLSVGGSSLGRSDNTPRTRSEKFNKSRRQENFLAELLKGRRHLCSGGLFFDKSDVSSALYRIEAKRTDKVKLAVEQGWLDKLDEENASDTRVTFLAIEVLGRHYGFIRTAHYVELEKEMGSYNPDDFIIVGTIKPRKENQKSISISSEKLGLLNVETQAQPLLSLTFNKVEYSIVNINYLKDLQTRYLAFQRNNNGQSDNS